MTQSWMPNLCTHLTDYLEFQSTFTTTMIKERLAKLTPIIFCKQEHGFLVHFVLLANTLLKDEESARMHETTTFLLVTLPNIRRFKFFSLADSAINLS